MSETTVDLDQDGDLRGFDDFSLSLGDKMRGERATMGKSLEDVEFDLKIKAHLLEAVENCDLSAFRTQSFIAGTVRSYASYLNLDPQACFEEFCTESGFDGVRPALAEEKAAITKAGMGLSSSAAAMLNDPIVNPRVPNQPMKSGALSAISLSGVISVAVLLGMIGGVGWLGYSVLQEVQRVEFTPVNETPGVTTDIARLDLGAFGAVDAAPTAPETRPDTQSALDDLYRPQELSVPRLEPRDGPIAAIDPTSFGSYAARPQIAEAPVLPSLPDQPVTVVEGPPPVDVFAVNPAWVRVYTDAGDILFEQTLDAGQRYRVPAGVAAPLLRAGNAGAVFVLVGDDAYGPVGGKGKVVSDIALADEAVRQTYNAPTQLADLYDAPIAEPVNLPLTAEAVILPASE